MNIEQLVISNAEWIRRKARWYYSNAEDADDLASETIYKCLSSGKRFDTARAFKPWAIAIMENTYITQYNRRRCVLFTGIEGSDTTDGVITSEQDAAVNRILQIVHDCSRKSVSIECVMLYADGYNYEEIAQMLDIPIGTVKSRVSVGRKILREALR